ncbi:short-chain dehydrogenase/reductase [Hydrococcus rivularis NIES-593]|uniref:Short-chain dehydrogenase/reductase n=1 Tax=Hydrococcus rivularis NIES-593 TaxID=1921803 RepID=A0A1U7HPX4_9CYAN|nr:SDR family oxidoreductase [Hydrococcus rivularis]OKH25584.1 short-chain dehydrogenase/reductase [Hydrococcus rivularis NIES-593]
MGTPSQDLPFSKRVILITGASAGIGAALAEALAKNFSGIRLVLSARRQDKLEQVATQCRQAGASVLVVPTNMADENQIKALAQSALQTFDRVDALVNNAGYGQMGPIELIPPEAAKQQFAVNFHAPLLLTQALIPAMRDRGGGRIVNISSLGGRMAFPAGGLYSCSKFALEALSDVLRMELKAFNIQVSVVEPGPVVTEFFRVAWEEIQHTVPEPTQTIYHPAFEKIEAIDKQLQLLGWTSERVAKVIIKALTARHPRPRYIAATGGSIFVPLMTKVMPTRFTDAFWKHFYGIDRVEREWREKVRIAGKQL